MKKDESVRARVINENSFTTTSLTDTPGQHQEKLRNLSDGKLIFSRGPIKEEVFDTNNR